MNKSLEDEVRYRLLKMMHQDGQLSQRQMADAMGVSLGKINYCIKELIGRGLVKIDRIKNSKNKLGYIYVLTPQGLEAKARVTVRFLLAKRREYEAIKKVMNELYEEVERENLDWGLAENVVEAGELDS
ncbi:MAG: MarR family EPS-associated transcriptional regulator [Proteobacteria bacterium]|nr:MarR family EPS-associated transcriptional regulator [Pseudomonadota bacterium]MBU4384636.1 MarR family EPS-associated transcriptional regulator [Pseudomonadota bacterium]MCG2766216.1 MarR family EPS-associated transcriptional regulator [Desulfarculaceae bacterium]